MKFEGRKAVVVGGGGGMGEAICCGFAGGGADVAVLDIVLENAERVAKQVRELEREAIAMKVDVSDFQAVHACMDTVYKKFKRIDILVNGAGYGDLVPFAEMSEETWDRCIATHLKGTFNATRAVINGMIAQHSGRIINISSIAGVTGTPKHCQYSAAKAGVIGLTKALAKEVAPQGVTVNAIAPGAIKTPFIKNVPQSSLDTFIKATLAGRWGTPEEIAALVMYLASDEADFVTGQVININGGQYI